MSWRLWRPRPISAYEAQVVRRVLEVGAKAPPTPALLDSIDRLIVKEEGNGGCQHDSLEFDTSRVSGHIIAGAVGQMTNGTSVELILWERNDAIGALELAAFGPDTRFPIRMPLLETIAWYPDDTWAGDDEDDEQQSVG